MLEAMPSKLLSEWMAYYGLEPWGEVRADFRSAIVAKTVADVHRGEKQEPYPLQQFMPLVERAEEDEDEEPEPWQRMLAQVEWLNVAFGGRDLRGK